MGAIIIRIGFLGYIIPKPYSGTPTIVLATIEAPILVFQALGLRVCDLCFGVFIWLGAESLGFH